MNIYSSTNTQRNISNDGINIAIQNALQKTIKFNIEGNIHQETTIGKNLIGGFEYSRTSGGVTFTYNKDGSITCSGTSTSNNVSSMLSGTAVSNNYLFTLQAGTYTISGGLNNIKIQIVESDGTVIKTVSDYESFTLNTETIIFFRVNIPNTGTSVNTTIYPQLESGSSVTSYEPYTGGIPSPNPDYEQPIDIIDGYNLIDTTLINRTYNGCTWTGHTDGLLTIQGTLTSTGTSGATVNKKLKKGYHRFLIKEPIAKILKIRIDKDDGTYKYTSITSGATSVSFFLETTAHAYRIYMDGLISGEEINISCYPMLSESSDIKEYLPFNNIGLKNIGKNLLNKDTNIIGKYINASGGIISDTNFNYTDLIPVNNETYTLSGKQVETGTKTKRIHAYNNVGTWLAQLDFIDVSGTNNFSKTFTINNDDIKYIRISYLKTDENVQLEEDSTASEYQPYQEIIPPIDLQGNFIGKIGDTKDLLRYENRHIYLDKKIGKKVLDGSESYWVRATNGVFYGNNTNFNFQELPRDALSNYYLYGGTCINSSTAYNNGNNTISFNQNDKNSIYIRNDDITTLNDFKTWLSSHNTEVYYILAEPYTIDLGEYTIGTFKGVNNFQLLSTLPSNHFEITSSRDFNNNGYGFLDCISCKFTEVINGDEYLEFTLPINSPLSEYVVQDNIVKCNTGDNNYQLFRIKRVVKTFQEIQVYAIHIFYDLLDNFLSNVAPTDLASEFFGQWILNHTNFQNDFKFHSNIPLTKSARYVRKNPVEAIIGTDDNSMVNLFGGELERDNYDIYFNVSRGLDRKVKLIIGKNIKSIQITTDITSMFTRIMPVGFDGLLLPELYVDSPLIYSYPTPKVGKVEFSDIKYDPNDESAYHTEQEAYQALRNAVNSLYESGIDKPSINIKIDWLELSKTNEYKDYAVLEQVKLGDTIKAEILGLEYTTKVNKIVFNPITDMIENFEIGSFSQTIGTSINDNMRSIENIDVSSILDSAKNDATQQITTAMGGYIYKTRNELYIMDNSDPNQAQKVWRWNLNGLGYSSTGINGTYGLAMTQNGQIVADYITAGVLNLSTGLSINSDKFTVSSDGTIHSTGGTIGGYTIKENELYSEVYSEYDYTETDLNKVRDYLMGQGTLTPEEIIKYDINKDGVVNARDLLFMDQYIYYHVSTTTSAKLRMTTGATILDSSYLLEDGLGNEILKLGFNGFEYKGVNILNQEILWQGASFMHGNQSIDLSETPINLQPHGIVLIFSRYSGGTAQDYDFKEFFIPKESINLHSGVGRDFFLSNSKLAVIGSKYLYISNIRITGHDDNTATGTGASGITYTNNAWVLRYVIGV